MPRDSNGNYSNIGLYGNPVVTSTPIAITWWNQTNADYSTAMTDSLSRSGLGGMLVPFKLVNGSAGAPAFSFENESNTGFYLATAGEMDVSVGGTRLSRWTASGFQESFDNGSTWKTPVYLDVASQSMGSTGALDFGVGKLTINSVAVSTEAPRPVFSASASTGTTAYTSTSFTAVTNANLSYTATGGLVMVQLSSDFTSNSAGVYSFPTSGTTSPILTGLVLALSEDGGSTFKDLQTFNGVALYGITYTSTIFPVSGYIGWITPSAGARTIGLYVKTAAANTTAHVDYCKLTIIQFPL